MPCSVPRNHRLADGRIELFSVWWLSVRVPFGFVTINDTAMIVCEQDLFLNVLPRWNLFQSNHPGTFRSRTSRICFKQSHQSSCPVSCVLVSQCPCVPCPVSRVPCPVSCVLVSQCPCVPCPVSRVPCPVSLCPNVPVSHAQCPVSLCPNVPVSYTAYIEGYSSFIVQ